MDEIVITNLRQLQDAAIAAKQGKISTCAEGKILTAEDIRYSIGNPGDEANLCFFLPTGPARNNLQSTLHILQKYTMGIDVAMFDNPWDYLISVLQEAISQELRK